MFHRALNACCRIGACAALALAVLGGLGQPCRAQGWLNDGLRDLRRNRDELGRRANQAKDDAARDLQRARDEAIKRAEQAGGDLLNDVQKALAAAGQVIEKPFRDAGNNVKEAIFFAARDHVVSKNAELGIPGRRFDRRSRYHRFIQPHLPDGMDFSEIEWFFDAYIIKGKVGGYTFGDEMIGITFGDKVFIDWQDPEAFDEDYLRLMAHETAHVLQYRRLNMKGFARKYMDDVFGGFFRIPSSSAVKIHDAIDLEREADAFAERVMQAYAETMVEEDPIVTNDADTGSSGTGGGGQGVQGVTSNMSEGERIALAIIRALQAAAEEQRQSERTERPGRRNDGRPAQPRLGVNVEPIEGRGALVTSVADGMPGAAAGLEVDDIIVAVGDQRVESAEDVLDALRDVAAEGRRSVSLLIENQRLRNRPLDERFEQLRVEW